MVRQLPDTLLRRSITRARCRSAPISSWTAIRQDLSNRANGRDLTFPVAASCSWVHGDWRPSRQRRWPETPNWELEIGIEF
jgi:hypothetical protein